MKDKVQISKDEVDYLKEDIERKMGKLMSAGGNLDDLEKEVIGTKDLSNHIFSKAEELHKDVKSDNKKTFYQIIFAFFILSGLSYLLYYILSEGNYNNEESPGELELLIDVDNKEEENYDDKSGIYEVIMSG